VKIVPAPKSLPDARSVAMQVGVGRTLFGAAALAAPVGMVRLLGLDTATAQRVTWLARMAAARDCALGAGTVVTARSGRGAAGWLLAGAAADAVDALVVYGAVRQGRLRGAAPVGLAIGAAGVAAAGVAAAVGLRGA
jgi:hypothetical protein